MRGEVVQVGTAHHPLVGHVGRDEAVAGEGEVADGVSGTQGEHSGKGKCIGNSTSCICCQSWKLRTTGPLEPSNPGVSFTEDTTPGRCLTLVPTVRARPTL